MVVIHASWLYFILPHLAALSCACMCTNSKTPHALYCVSIAKWIPPTSCCTSWMHCYGCNTHQLTVLQITSLSSIVMCTNSKAPCALHWKLCFIVEWIPPTLCFFFKRRWCSYDNQRKWEHHPVVYAAMLPVGVAARIPCYEISISRP